MDDAPNLLCLNFFFDLCASTLARLPCLDLMLGPIQRQRIHDLVTVLKSVKVKFRISHMLHSLIVIYRSNKTIMLCNLFTTKNVITGHRPYRI